LAANAVLIAIVLLKPHGNLSATTTVKPLPALAPQSEHIALDKAAWDKLAAGNDTAFVARLRTEGFPLHVIAALVHAHISSKYADALRALASRDAEAPYWRTEPWSYDFNPETRAERRALYRKIADEYRQLLGTDIDLIESDYARGERIRNFGPIPQAKVSAIEAIQRDYSELSSQIRDAMKGVALAEDREKLAFLEKEKRSDLAQLLTPDELAEYDKRNSPAATSLRNQMRYFDASEEEFLKLYEQQKAFDARYGRDNLSGVQADRRREAEKELKMQFEAALGPERYAEYQITTDGNFSSTRYFILDAGLPIETAKSLVAVQRELTQRANATRSSTTLTREQQTSELAALEKEAEAKVSSLVSADKLKNYKSNAGQWMTKLSPSVKLPTPR
jgi:hypothetical protein